MATNIRDISNMKKGLLTVIEPTEKRGRLVQLSGCVNVSAETLQK